MRAWSTIGVLVLVAFPAKSEEPSREGVEFFEARIRPVLVEHCYACHNSADDAQGGLAVDHRAALLKGGETGAVVVPGNVAKSRLPAILRHEVDGLEMPQDGPRLSRQVVTDFENWIAMGAPDPRDEPPSAADIARTTSWEAVRERRKQWWSFQPIRDPELPDVGDETAHPVDRFLLAKLNEADLEPSEPADSTTLVRRAYFALIGLPPTPAEVTRWTARLDVADPTERDAAYGELVDELLASPRFGERWARHWMDWIRYAESHGSEGDPAIAGAWRYRDYLIRALNSDVPYDQLLREHVAGDLLPEPRINPELGINESLVGTAHWRMVFHGFAPTDALDERVRFTDDQINAFSKAFLGLTVSCARCHDHKFDAISQRDYYALFGVLRSCRPGRAAIETVARQRTNADELAALKPRIRTALAKAWLASLPALEQRLRDPAGPVRSAKEIAHPLHPLFRMREVPAADFAGKWRDELATWERDQRSRAENADREAHRRWRLGDRDDFAAWHRTGVGLPKKPQPAGTFVVATEGESALRDVYPAGVYSHGISSKHAARLTSPDVPLDGDDEVWIRCTGGDEATVRYAVHDYPRSGTVYPVAKLGDWQWRQFDLQYWANEEVHVELTTAADAPLLAREILRSWFGVREVLFRKKGAPPPQESPEHLVRFFEEARSEPAKSFDELPGTFVDALRSSIEAWQAGKATDADATLLSAALGHGLLPNRLADLPDVQPLVERYRELEAAVPVPTRVPALEETPGRDQPLYVRGNHRKPGDLVPRRFLEAIDDTPYDATGSGRLQLAEDLMREDNPFPRRVIVNRLWHHLFGAGIVRTPDNLGRLGEEPTHPELLDWLATRFAEEGWSLKRTIRLLVTSRAWQRSSQPSARATEVDPENRLLSHAHVRRLEAEAIRDALLAVSGSLDDTMYGPPVDGNAGRRSVYVRVVRNRLDPFLRAFDFPEPFSTVGRRDVTNVPAQSLVWMNDARVNAVAEEWVTRLLREEPSVDDAARIRAMFTRALGREPTGDEVERVRMFLHRTDADHAEAIARAADLRRQLDEQRTAIATFVEPTRKRLLDARRARTAKPESLPQPIGRWEFDGDARDSIGSAHGTLRDGARIEDGALVLDGRKAHVVTAKLDRDLTAKTLEAWVRLDNVSQRGGGAVSVQTPNGAVFDAIVFGERDPGQWLAGSNNFRRTDGFGGDRETEATERSVHVAIAYHADGRIQGFRDGRPYGKAYESNGPQRFAKGETVVTFGVRHLPAVGNRLLAGRIERAQLYDRALSPEEVAASAGTAGEFVSMETLLAALSPEDRERHEERAAEITRLERELAVLGPLPARMDDAARWRQLALAMFALKEFFYLR